MPKLHLDWSDGCYSTRPLTDEEAAKCEALGIEVVHLEDGVYSAYLRHCAQDGVWQAFWRAISNEQSMRRREKELMPLEEAEREIRQLKEELARAKRLEKFYEDQYTRQLGELHRAECCEYICLYPQPGCKIDELPFEWQERAQEILDRSAGLEDGMKFCCCGGQEDHKKLDAATTERLRIAGFLVEHRAVPM